MTPKVIFVAGVHGVGKGTICQKISSYFAFPHYSASDLIKSVKNAEVDNNKIVIDANKNQDYLILALENLNVDSNYILVDGHFCLQGDNGVIEIPLETFQGMELAEIVLLTDDPDKIYSRLYARDNNALAEDVIRFLQDKEIERAEYVAGYLDIPILKAKINDSQTIFDWLSPILN